MPWHIGIDEAGYGPNMGPLLQTAVGVRFPAKPRDGWRALATLAGWGQSQRMADKANAAGAALPKEDGPWLGRAVVRSPASNARKMAPSRVPP